MKQLLRHIQAQIAFNPYVVLFRNFHVPHGVLNVHLESEICTIFINLSSFILTSFVSVILYAMEIYYII
jgi:hypothetical protein